jgi:hypothetical protein
MAGGALSLMVRDGYSSRRSGQSGFVRWFTRLFYFLGILVVLMLLRSVL